MNRTSTYQPLPTVEYENIKNTKSTGNGVHKGGFTWNRLFGSAHPYDEIEWDIRSAKITKGDGKVVFEQNNIEKENSKKEPEEFPEDKDCNNCFYLGKSQCSHCIDKNRFAKQTKKQQELNKMVIKMGIV